MICHKCGKEAITMYEESFDCECGKTNIIAIHVCDNCSLTWRSYNGEPLEASEIRFEDFLSGEPANINLMSLEDNEVLKNMDKELLKVDRVKQGKAKSMSDYIHNCIKCGAVAHEAKDGTYKCGECGFEWEIISFE
jgi:hypothetical protein